MPYIYPDPGLRPLVMVPPEHVGWVCDQPDSVLSARAPQVSLFFFYHSCQSMSHKVCNALCAWQSLPIS